MAGGIGVPICVQCGTRSNPCRCKRLPSWNGQLGLSSTALSTSRVAASSSPSSSSNPSRAPLQKSAPSNRSLVRLSFFFSKLAVSPMDLFASSTSPRVDDGVLVDFTGYGRWWVGRWWLARIR
ncbi:hypothetical protein G4B88_029971 [Cannabis sativa]|uniref:Uncharacterized protein n=1 Tax=Cannabis sativa TaxID=3483 RepID=A0A7J6GCV1_CANSA|nr:hypothetical protein G4B88_029971 [Cannabis sativa]